MLHLQTIDIDTRETSHDLWLRRAKMLAPMWTLLVLSVFFSVASGGSFTTWTNINQMMSQIAATGILAVGMTFVLLTGEIDVSIAGVMVLSATVAAHLYDHQIPEPIPIMAGLMTGVLCGIGSGLISRVIGVPTLISTLVMQVMASGLALWIQDGRSWFLIVSSPLVLWIGSANIGGDNGLHSGVLIGLTMLCFLIGYLVLRFTYFGRYVYMTGANPSAARLAGISTRTMKVSVLTICGFTAGLAGIAHSGFYGAMPILVRNEQLIQAIAVVALGNTVLTGGRGSMWQTALGLLVYGSLINGLDHIAHVDPLAKTLITGLVLLAALILNTVFAGSARTDRTRLDLA